MRLSVEEYRRGILSWDIEANATFRTATSASHHVPPEWSEPLSDPRGSRVQSPPYRYAALSLDSIDDEGALRRPFQVRWERLVDDMAATRIWDSDLTNPPTTLVHVPHYGKFHRLVVATPYLAWAEAPVLLVENVRVRFIEGKVKGEHIEPMDQLQVRADETSITGGFSGSSEAEGRFIEVVAPGESAEAAEFSAYALMGLLAVTMGDHVIGQVIFSEPYHAEVGHQHGVLRIPVTARFPREAQGGELDLLEQSLPIVLNDGRMDRAGRLALRWYEKGGRSEVLADRFLGYFIGIEAILNANLAEYGPAPEVTKRKARFSSLIKYMEKRFPKDELSAVEQRLVESTLTERVKFYIIRRRKLDEALISKFRRLARLRSDLVHGDPSDIGTKEVDEAKDFLVRLLKSELGLPTELEWEKVPHISLVRARYEVLIQQGDRIGPLEQPVKLQTDTNPDG